ncbi:type II toxin-antitoxin system VapC family toxin [Archaeoglobales archaeon]|nr:MAG: type II toxin-antitoxin system VapC family toxin [Archaeoglobales archaeon]
MEENLYDTSKLIDAYKKSGEIHGYTTIFNLVEFPKALEFDLTVLYPLRSDYNLALEMSTELLKMGRPIPAVDVIISAIALNNKLKVITKDRRFLFIKEIRKDFEVVVE